jgi:hypothetical protein
VQAQPEMFHQILNVSAMKDMLKILLQILLNVWHVQTHVTDVLVYMIIVLYAQGMKLQEQGILPIVLVLPAFTILEPHNVLPVTLDA